MTKQVHGRKWKYYEELPQKCFQTRCVFQWDLLHFPERGNFHTEQTLPQLIETDGKFQNNFEKLVLSWKYNLMWKN